MTLYRTRRLMKIFRFLNFFSRDKHGNPVWQNNCLYCLYKYAMTVNIVFSPLRGECRHLTKGYNGKTKFWFSKKRLFLPIAFLLVNVLGTTLYLFDMLETCGENRSRCFLELHDHLVIITTLALMFVVLFKLRLRSKELNHLSHILEVGNFLCHRSLICDKYGKLIYMMNHLIVTLSAVSILLFGLPYYVSSGDEVFDYHFICLFLCQALQLSFACQVSQKLVLLRVLYRAVHWSIKKGLFRRKNGIQISLEADLRKTIHVYLNLKEIVDKLCDFMNPTLIIWVTPHIAQTVFHTYASIKSINIVPAHLIIIGQTKITLALMVIVSIFTDCQHLVDESKRTLDLLFMCPLTEMDHMEGLLIEMAIETLKSQPPRIHGSNLITISSGLICSVSGTILTYLLVVLQFKPFTGSNGR